MASIFNISKDILDVFAELEENGGELTEELSDKLSVSKDNLKDKLKQYADIIKYTEGEIDVINKEIIRLMSVRQSKQKAIDRMKNVMIWAIDSFGEENKSGNKYIDYGTGKVSIRNSEKVEINDDVVNNVVENTINYFNNLRYTKKLNKIAEIDVKDCINAISSITNENPVTINEDEFNNIDVKFSIMVNLKKLTHDEGLQFMRILTSFCKAYRVTNDTSKVLLKDVLSNKDKDISHIAKLVPNKTINIK